MDDGIKQRWGIVDIGSNTVRLCVYDINENSRHKKMASAKVSTALASYVDDNGALSEAGIREGAQSVRKLCQMAKLMGCTRILPFATAALRNCSNSSEAVSAIQERTGYTIQVLSSSREAQLSLKGALESVDFRSGLFFDIGGGSTELMELKRGRYVAGDSIPIGSLTSWSHAVEAVLPTPEELEALSAHVGKLLDSATAHLIPHAQVCGIGGTMRLAWKVCRHLHSADESHVVTSKDLQGIIDIGEGDPKGFARMVLQMNPARIHTFLPGCIIAKEILTRSGCDRMTIAKTGVREGYLAANMQAIEGK